MNCLTIHFFNLNVYTVHFNPALDSAINLSFFPSNFVSIKTELNQKNGFRYCQINCHLNILPNTGFCMPSVNWEESKLFILILGGKFHLIFGLQDSRFEGSKFGQSKYQSLKFISQCFKSYFVSICFNSVELLNLPNDETIQIILISDLGALDGVVSCN